MTDRINALVVVLEKDIRHDDAAAIISAICQLRWVIDVKPNVADIGDHVARSRARCELLDKIIGMIEGE